MYCVRDWWKRKLQDVLRDIRAEMQVMCDSVYVGETAGRSTYVRGEEHLAAMDSELESSVLNRHFRERHEGLVTDFTMSVTGVYAGDAMLRQIAESVKINKKEQAKVINNKTEWNYVNVPRARVT